MKYKSLGKRKQVTGSGSRMLPRYIGVGGGGGGGGGEEII